MSLVLAIDPGIRNLAYCVMDMHGTVLQINRVDLFNGNEIVVAQVFDQIHAWCEQTQSLFDMCDRIVCEKQYMNTKITISWCLLVVETVIRCFAKEKFVHVHAMSIKRAYHTSTGDYRKNKQAAVQRALSLCPLLNQTGHTKIDDLCDAYLLAHFYTFHLKQHISFSRLGLDLETNATQYAKTATHV